MRPTWNHGHFGTALLLAGTLLLTHITPATAQVLQKSFNSSGTFNLAGLDQTQTLITGLAGVDLATEGYVVSVNATLGISSTGSLNLLLRNMSSGSVTEGGTSKASYRVLDGFDRELNSSSQSSTFVGTPVVSLNTIPRSVSGGDGSITRSLDTAALGAFNWGATTITLRTAGISYTTDPHFQLESVTGSASTQLTFSGTIRYINQHIWNQTGGGTWGTGAHWRGGQVPDQSDLHVALANTLSGSASISLEDHYTVGTLHFDGPNSYSLTSGGAGAGLSFEGSDRGVNVRSGNHTIDVPLSIVADTGGFFPTRTNFFVEESSTLTVSGGTADSGGILKIGEGKLRFNDLAPNNGNGVFLGEGRVEFDGVGTTRNVSVALGWDPNAVLAFNLSVPSVTFSGRFIRESSGIFGSASGGVLEVRSTNGLAHELVLAPSSSNTFQNGTRLYSGLIAIGHNSALGSGTLTVDAVASGQAGIRAQGGTRTVNNAIQIVGNDLTVTGSGTLILSGSISGQGGITKSDTGSLTLTGNSTYTGMTIVEEGILRVSGSLAPTGIVEIDDGGRLEGTGSAGNVELKDGGTVAPGVSPGKLTLQNFTWEAGGTMAFELGATPAPSNSDQITITGGFLKSGDGAYSFHFNDGIGAPQETTYVLLSFGSASGWTTADFSYVYTGSQTGFSGSFTLNADNLSFTVVPEPSSILLLMVSAAFLGRRPRNRRRSMAPHTCTPSRLESPQVPLGTSTSTKS
jgi:autotransporter-associated beta strand protein